MIDWQAIKTEYITTDTSYRKLAQKYGVSYNAVGNRSRQEKWQELRDQHLSKTMTKTIDKIGDKQAAQMARIDGITNKLLAKLEKAVDELDLDIIIVKEKMATDAGERTEESRFVRDGGIVDRAGLRQVTAALKDLKEIQMLKSELDRQEQEARIEKLRADARQNRNDDDDDETGVILMPPVKEVPADG